MYSTGYTLRMATAATKACPFLNLLPGLVAAVLAPDVGAA